MGTGHCSRKGAHWCASPASHGRWYVWPEDGPYMAHIGGVTSPSAWPLRLSAVMRLVAALRGLRAREMFAEADRMHGVLWAAFRQKRREAMEALPADARDRVEDMARLAGMLDRAGLADPANDAYRRAYSRLGLEVDARNLEEVPAAYTAAIGERIGGGRLGGQRLLLFRHAEDPEAISVADSGAFAHHGGQDHLSFSLYRVEDYEDRPVLFVLGLTGNAVAHVRPLEYRSLAFSAPGSSPQLQEKWDGAKSWRTARECEVRLRTPLPVRGLDLTVYLERLPEARAWRSLRGLCGARKAIVPGLWPPDL